MDGTRLAQRIMSCNSHCISMQSDFLGELQFYIKYCILFIIACAWLLILYWLDRSCMHWTVYPKLNMVNHSCIKESIVIRGLPRCGQFWPHIFHLHYKYQYFSIFLDINLWDLSKKPLRWASLVFENITWCLNNYYVIMCQNICQLYSRLYVHLSSYSA